MANRARHSPWACYGAMAVQYLQHCVWNDWVGVRVLPPQHLGRSSSVGLCHAGVLHKPVSDPALSCCQQCWRCIMCLVWQCMRTLCLLHSQAKHYTTGLVLAITSHAFAVSIEPLTSWLLKEAKNSTSFGPPIKKITGAKHGCFT